jgi:hypothetical protein
MYTYSGRFVATQAQAKIPHANLHRVAEGGKAKHLNFLALEQPHFQEALANGIDTSHTGHLSALTALKLVEIHHRIPQTAGSRVPSGRTRISVGRWLRRHSRTSPIRSKQGQPACKTQSRHPLRTPISANRWTIAVSPQTFATSAHSPGLNSSRGSNVSVGMG